MGDLAQAGLGNLESQLPDMSACYAGQAMPLENIGTYSAGTKSKIPVFLDIYMAADGTLGYDVTSPNSPHVERIFITDVKAATATKGDVLRIIGLAREKLSADRNGSASSFNLEEVANAVFRAIKQH